MAHSPCADIDRCSLDFGHEIILLYWPPSSPQRDREACGLSNVTNDQPHLTTKRTNPVSVVLPAVTFPGEDILQVFTNPVPDNQNWVRDTNSVLQGPFTLTSPTVYIAHRDVRIATLRFIPPGTRDIYEYFPGMEGDGPVRTVRAAGLFPVNAENIYTYRLKMPGPIRAYGEAKPQYGYYPVDKDSKHQYIIESPEYDLLQINFADLVNPVPANLYYSGRTWCEGARPACATITDDTYRPSLVIRDSAWISVFSNEASCFFPVLNDPPVALRPVEGLTLEPPSLPAGVPAERTAEIESTSATETAESAPGMESTRAAETAEPAGKIEPDGQIEPASASQTPKSDERTENAVAGEPAELAGRIIGAIAVEMAGLGGAIAAEAVELAGRVKSVIVVQTGSNDRFTFPKSATIARDANNPKAATALYRPENLSSRYRLSLSSAILVTFLVSIIQL
jgi:hypothetical protein